jgi:hypothetical protein
VLQPKNFSTSSILLSKTLRFAETLANIYMNLFIIVLILEFMDELEHFIDFCFIFVEVKKIIDCFLLLIEEVKHLKSHECDKNLTEEAHCTLDLSGVKLTIWWRDISEILFIVNEVEAKALIEPDLLDEFLLVTCLLDNSFDDPELDGENDKNCQLVESSHDKAPEVPSLLTHCHSEEEW